MKSKILLLVGFFILSISLLAQNAQSTTIKPLLLDKSVLSGVGLQKIDLKNEPEKTFHQRNLFRGKDISVYVVSTETWNNRMDNFSFDEFVYMFHGEAIVKPESGPSQLFYSGDYFFAPKGFTGEWEIRAGKQLHYELSVISSQRAEQSKVSKNLKHRLFNRSTLSGAHIELDENGIYSEILQEGVELSIVLNAEKPAERKLSSPFQEAIIQMLSGQLTLTDKDGESQTFYSGDFFVIPDGFTGNWKSEGHGLVKYLIVGKTKR